MTAGATIVWFRQDLRLADHPALAWAIGRSGNVIPVYIWSPAEEGTWQPGGASRWWLHHSLEGLARALAALGSRLVIRRGPAAESLLELAAESGATAVVWTERGEPAARAQETDVAAALRQAGVAVQAHPGWLLHRPEGLQTQQGRPFQVFTPFWKAFQAQVRVPPPLPPPAALPPVAARIAGLPVEALGLLPRIEWTSGLRSRWQPGEDGARAALDRFLDEAAADYPHGRDRPARPGTSRLSPHLHQGEIAPAAVWRAVSSRLGVARAGDPEGAGEAEDAAQAYLRQLGWREFGAHLLWHSPHTTDAPLRPGFAGFPWRSDPEGQRAWQRGVTGFPLVDAGMRELWTTGWMHNRVRMVAASFLVKDLLVPWLDGARWFWDTLVDADLANNTLGWQWTAGCGADAAPWFRIFNPVAQGKRFDPTGDYVRRWVPELAGLPDAHLHDPGSAPDEVLRRAGVLLGSTYPAPIVSHAAARQRALAALAAIRG